jgi:hypothetical protein
MDNRYLNKQMIAAVIISHTSNDEHNAHSLELRALMLNV